MVGKEIAGDEDDALGHGGKRVKGLTGQCSDEHEAVESVERMRASAWFAFEKLHRAEEQPNELGIGKFQIDRIEISDYYNEFCLDMADLLLLSDEEIPKIGVWRGVWDTEHPDLVMRVHKNVDHKDKVSRIVAFSLDCFHFFV